MHIKWKKGTSALTAAAMTLSALTMQLVSVQAAVLSAPLLTNTSSDKASYKVDLSSIDVSLVDRIEADLTVDTAYANGCFGYNSDNPDYDPTDETSSQFNWNSIDWELAVAEGTVSVEGLAGTLSQDSPTIEMQTWWINEVYEGEEAVGDGTMLLNSITVYDADGNILGFFGIDEDALLTATTTDAAAENAKPTYDFNFVGIDASAVDKIEAVIAVDSGYISGSISYTDTTITVDPEDETSTNWVSVDCESNGYYNVWTAEGLAGKLDAENPTANLQLWYVNPFYVWNEETEESTVSDDGTAQLVEVRYYDVDGNLLVPTDINTALLERTSDATGDSSYAIPFVGLDASEVDRIEAEVYVDSAYVNGCIGFNDVTAEDPDAAWITTECETNGEYGTWTIEGLAGKLDPNYASAQIQFWFVNPFYDKDTGEVDEDGNPIYEAGSTGTAKLLSVTLYDAAGNVMTPVDINDYLVKKNGNGADYDGDSVPYVINFGDVDPTAVASMELFFYTDSGYVNGCIGYNNAEGDWSSINYDCTTMFGSTLIEGIDGTIADGAQIQLWWVDEFQNDTGEVDENGDPIMEYVGEGTSYLLSVAFYDADGTLLGYNGQDPAGLAAPEAPNVFYGDTDCNGVITVADSVLTARYVAEDSMVDVTDAGLLNADCNGDGIVNAQDISSLNRYIAGLVEKLGPVA